jgi:hypothetical protein
LTFASAPVSLALPVSFAPPLFAVPLASIALLFFVAHPALVVPSVSIAPVSFTALVFIVLLFLVALPTSVTLVFIDLVYCDALVSLVRLTFALPSTVSFLFCVVSFLLSASFYPASLTPRLTALLTSSAFPFVAPQDFALPLILVAPLPALVPVLVYLAFLDLSAFILDYRRMQDIQIYERKAPLYLPHITHLAYVVV